MYQDFKAGSWFSKLTFVIASFIGMTFFLCLTLTCIFYFSGEADRFAKNLDYLENLFWMFATMSYMWSFDNLQRKYKALKETLKTDKDEKDREDMTAAPIG